MSPTVTTLDDKLVIRILERSGPDVSPSVDLDGLRHVYAAWCLSVPFDNVAKLIALRSGHAPPLPGMVEVAVAYCGVCGSDVAEYAHGPFAIRERPHPLSGQAPPVTLGHELAGVRVDL